MILVVYCKALNPPFSVYGYDIRVLWCSHLFLPVGVIANNLENSKESHSYVKKAEKKRIYTRIWKKKSSTVQKFRLILHFFFSQPNFFFANWNFSLFCWKIFQQVDRSNFSFNICWAKRLLKVQMIWYILF